MRRRAFLRAAAGVAGAAALAGCRGARRRADPAKPSFLILLTDDQRADALGCAGHPVLKTPAIDGLAAEGTYFSNQFVTTSICPTSRASIQTGQWASRHGVWGFWHPLSAAALASSYSGVLRAAGWRTGLVGKWGIGGPPPEGPFDEYRGFIESVSYLRTDHGRRVYDTDLDTEQAAAFIREAGATPFCLTVCYKAPHGGRDELQPGYERMFAETAMPEAHAPAPGEPGSAPPALLATAGGRSHVRRAAQHLGQQEARNYFRLLAGIDASVAALLATLRETGADTRTVVLFTSDNGLLFGEHGMAGKWVAYEESIRVPLIVRDPAAPRAARGRREPRMTLNVDIAPTVLDRAGVPAPAAMQGTSFAPLVRGETPPWREDWYYEFRAMPGQDEDASDESLSRSQKKVEQAYEKLGLATCEGVRGERWKYVRYVDTTPPCEQLFDLAADPREEDDRAADPAASSELERLRARCAALRAAVR